METLSHSGQAIIDIIRLMSAFSLEMAEPTALQAVAQDVMDGRHDDNESIAARTSEFSTCASPPLWLRSEGAEPPVPMLPLRDGALLPAALPPSLPPQLRAAARPPELRRLSARSSGCGRSSWSQINSHGCEACRCGIRV